MSRALGSLLVSIELAKEVDSNSKIADYTDDPGWGRWSYTNIAAV